MAIQLTVVVDTASLPSGAGSSPENPRSFGHDGAFMITDSTHCANNNGSADLQITGTSVGDSFQIWGSSLSNQFLDEVFIYDFKHLDGDKVLDVNGLKPQIFNEDVMVPTTGGISHNPATFTSQPRTFPCTEIDITGHGKESFLVRFLVYGPMAKGGRAVKGFYQWDPSIQAI